MHGSGTYIKKKWELIELMTIHPEFSVVVFSAKLYIKKLGQKSVNRKMLKYANR